MAKVQHDRTGSTEDHQKMSLTVENLDRSLRSGFKNWLPRFQMPVDNAVGFCAIHSASITRLGITGSSSSRLGVLRSGRNLKSEWERKDRTENLASSRHGVRPYSIERISLSERRPVPYLAKGF
jgi:hypothetical protein